MSYLSNNLGKKLPLYLSKYYSFEQDDDADGPITNPGLFFLSLCYIIFFSILVFSFTEHVL